MFGLFARWMLLKVEGDSMSPSLRNGALVLADRNVAAKVGDVVVARDPRSGELIIKRVVQIEGGYWLEGDAHRAGTATTSTDSWVFGAVESVEAVVIWPSLSKAN